MSERIDRRIGSGHLLLVTVILVALAGAGIFVWVQMMGRAGSALPGQPAPLPAPIPRPDEPLTVTLYLPGGGSLSGAAAPVKRQPDVQAQAGEALNAIFAHSSAVQSPVLKALKVRTFFIDRAGTAYVDLVPVNDDGIRTSAWEELLAIYSIVNTLSQNFEEIKQVRFLLDGREAQTLAGHIDLTGAFTKRLDLVRQ